MSEPAESVLEAFPVNRETARIRGLQVIEIPVSDMQRALEFYVGQLGFYIDLQKNPPSIWATSTEVFIKPAAGVQIMLQLTDGHERLGFTLNKEPRPFLIMEIDEPAEAVWNRLRAAGAKTGEIVDHGGCGTVFTVWDPDGNILKLNYQPGEQNLQKIDRICFAYIPVTDIKRSAAWYSEMLGFKLECVFDSHAILQPDLQLLRTDAPVVHTMLNGKPLPRTAYFCHNIYEFHNEVNRRGALTEEIIDEGECGWHFEIYDPDGNRITVWQAK